MGGGSSGGVYSRGDGDAGWCCIYIRHARAGVSWDPGDRDIMTLQSRLGREMFTAELDVYFALYV